MTCRTRGFQVCSFLHMSLQLFLFFFPTCCNSLKLGPNAMSSNDLTSCFLHFLHEWTGLGRSGNTGRRVSSHMLSDRPCYRAAHANFSHPTAAACELLIQERRGVGELWKRTNLNGLMVVLCTGRAEVLHLRLAETCTAIL